MWINRVWVLTFEPEIPLSTGADHEWHAVPNIRIAQASKLEHDIVVSDIIAPGDSVKPAKSVAPIAKILNVGTSDETNVPVTCEITAPGAEAYSSTQIIRKIGSLKMQEVVFARWIPQEIEKYEIKITAKLPGDENADNDEVKRMVKLAPLWETIRAPRIEARNDICALSAKEIWAVGEGYMLAHTKDSGKTWIRVGRTVLGTD
jgi:hypothetical protein